jgi:hypothetical protein
MGRVGGRWEFSLLFFPWSLGEGNWEKGSGRLIWELGVPSLSLIKSKRMKPHDDDDDDDDDDDEMKPPHTPRPHGSEILLDLVPSSSP